LSDPPREANWIPILDADEGTRARAALQRIVGQLASSELTDLPAARLAERALLFSYLAGAEICNDGPCVQELLDLAAENTSLDLPAALYGGLSGIGWIFQHLAVARDVSSFIEEDTGEPDALSNLDSVLRLRCETNQIDTYDLITGLTGIGVYLLERPSTENNRSALAAIVTKLAERAERNPDGVAWWTPPEHLSDFERSLCPDGYYNLGVAHGIPAVFTFLKQLIDAGIERDMAEELRKGAVNWFLAQQQDVPAGSWFGNWIFRRCKPVKQSRVAWCYGDLGIGALLLEASKGPGNGALNVLARELLDGCTNRTSDGVVEPTLCHGSSGVAHIFNRAYQQTWDGKYLDAAKRYYGLTLSFLERDHASDPIGDGLLDGLVGIALALLAAVSPIEPEWDRLLMLSSNRPNVRCSAPY
jgi:lantibiotic biosynthesis protein